jgi:hypothetical protein
LANPWQLALAVIAYTDHASDPGDLLTMSPEQAQTHLLDRLIPAVVERDETAAQRGWTTPHVTGWLTTIAQHQHRSATYLGRSETDIHLPDLWRTAGRTYPQWIPALVTAAPFLTLAAYFAATGDIIGIIFGIMTALGGGVIGRSSLDTASPVTRLDIGVLRTAQGRQKFRNKIAVGLVGGLGKDAVAASSVTSLVRQCLTYAAGAGLAFGLVFGLPVVLAAGLTYVLAAGLAAGLAFGKGYVWLRYALGVRSAARQGRLPQRPARFLDWCLHAGLMRMAGNSIQFRHRQLQDWLTNPRNSERTETPV